MNAPRYGPGIEVTAEVTPEFVQILTPDALAFAARLQRAFGARRTELLARRVARQVQFDAGELPDFLADKKGEVFDEDLHALISDDVVEPAHEHYRLAALKVTSETGTVPHARVVMAIGDAEVVAEVAGDGPVDAVFKSIERMAGSHANLLLYSVNAITGGTDAQGEVTVRLEQAGRIVNGLGADTDIVVASAKAYINALNRLHDGVVRLNPQRAA